LVPEPPLTNATRRRREALAELEEIVNAGHENARGLRGLLYAYVSLNPSDGATVSS
jgi:hypothetical protein